jgi:hypothetical protein
MASNYNTTNNNIPTGYNDPAGTHGPHHSAVGNAMDPRVDSDRDGRALGRDAVNNPGAPGTAGVSTAGNHGAGVGATSTTGTARTATGPGEATSTSQSHNPVQPHSGSGGGLVESVKGRIAQVHVSRQLEIPRQVLITDVFRASASPPVGTSTRR